MSRALDLAKRGCPDLVKKYPDERFLSNYRLGTGIQIAAPNLVSPSPEIFTQILALLAFHTNRSKKISRLPCALGHKTIGISQQHTKEMEAMF